MPTVQPPARAGSPRLPSVRVPCVGAVIADEAGRLLLILRGHDPGKGLWSVPGGRIEAGESDQEAVAREVKEETGLEVTCGRLLGSIELPGLDGALVEVRDYLAAIRPGTATTAVAGDDAADAIWASPEEVAQLEADGQLTPGLLSTLTSWGAV